MNTHGEEPRSTIGSRIVGALLKVKEPRIKVECSVLIGHELRDVHHILQQHDSSPALNDYSPVRKAPCICDRVEL